VSGPRAIILDGSGVIAVPTLLGQSPAALWRAATDGFRGAGGRRREG